MNYTYENKDDYDKIVKLSGKKIQVYSKEKLAKLHKKRTIHIVGEILPGKRFDKDSELDAFSFGELTIPVYSIRTFNRIRYREVGYICVGNNNFVAVLGPNCIIPLFIVLLAVIACIIYFYEPDEPVIDDPNIGIIIDDNTEPTDNNTGKGSVSLTYSLEATLDKSTNDIGVYFLNPRKSNHSISLDLYLIDGNEKSLMASSGIIDPGYGINNMDFDTSHYDIDTGEYEGEYIVKFYDMDTHEKAILESSIADVNISVLD